MPRVFCSNETITMPKLHEQLSKNDGVYLNLLDEIEGLFESLDSKEQPDSLDIRIWLSLYNGASWSRNSKSGLKELKTARLSYTGWKLFTFMLLLFILWLTYLMKRVKIAVLIIKKNFYSLTIL